MNNNRAVHRIKTPTVGFAALLKGVAFPPVDVGLGPSVALLLPSIVVLVDMIDVTLIAAVDILDVTLTADSELSLVVTLGLDLRGLVRIATDEEPAAVVLSGIDEVPNGNGVGLAGVRVFVEPVPESTIGIP